MTEADELKAMGDKQKQLIDEAMTRIRKAVEEVLQDRKDQTAPPSHQP